MLVYQLSATYQFILIRGGFLTKAALFLGRDARHPASRAAACHNAGMTRLINKIIIHCSASANGDSLFKGSLKAGNLVTPVEVIDSWHKGRGFKRAEAFRKRQNASLTSIGYHFVIYTSGAIVTGRHLDEIGAHVQGKNANSIGVCMIGTNAFTSAQWAALATLIKSLPTLLPNAKVSGHRDNSPDLNGDGQVSRNEWLKICPGFDVSKWLKADMQPELINIWEAEK